MGMMTMIQYLRCLSEAKDGLAEVGQGGSSGIDGLLSI